MPNDSMVGKVVRLISNLEANTYRLYKVTDEPYDGFADGKVREKTVRNWLDNGLKIELYERSEDMSKEVKKPTEGHWTVSHMENTFQTSAFFWTKEEAIRYGENEYPGNFYVGQVSTKLESLSVDVEEVLESVAQRVYDEVGEVSEDYLRIIEREHVDELEENMNKVLNEWLAKHNYEPNFYHVHNIELVEMEEK